MKKEENRSPEGNTWSAVPVALLCMIVNLNERQGSALWAALCARMGSIWALENQIISKHFSCSNCKIRAQSTRKIDLNLI